MHAQAFVRIDESDDEKSKARPTEIVRAKAEGVDGSQVANGACETRLGRETALQRPLTRACSRAWMRDRGGEGSRRHGSNGGRWMR
jgi:hypothetical protein